MSVFRRLRELGYLSSYTHNGRYYTLAGVPDFDENGLWFHRGIGFSQVGTLKETAAQRLKRTAAPRPIIDFRGSRRRGGRPNCASS